MGLGGVALRSMTVSSRQRLPKGEARLSTHASLLMARPAFEAMGFRVIAAERIARSCEYLDRFEMEKILT